MQTKLLMFFIMISFSSCLGWGDIFSYKKSISENYEIAEDPGTGKKDIYFTNGDVEIGRIEDVVQVGWNDSIIIARSNNGYFILDKSRDSLNAEPRNVVDGPFDQSTFLNRLKSAQVKNIEFKISYQ